MAKEYIYLITNQVNGKHYVGRTINPKKRYSMHLCRLRNGNHHSPSLQHDFDECGEEAFKFEIIDNCSPNDNGQCEVEWMKKYQSFLPEYGYNDSDSSANALRRELGIDTVSSVPKGTPSGLKGKQRITVPDDVSFDGVNEDERRYYEEYHDGVNTVRIAEIHGVSTFTVNKAIHKVLKRNGYVTLKGRSVPLKCDEELVRDLEKRIDYQIRERNEVSDKYRNAMRENLVLKELLEEHNIPYKHLI